MLGRVVKMAYPGYAKILEWFSKLGKNWAFKRFFNYRKFGILGRHNQQWKFQEIINKLFPYSILGFSESELFFLIKKKQIKIFRFSNNTIKFWDLCEQKLEIQFDFENSIRFLKIQFDFW